MMMMMMRGVTDRPGHKAIIWCAFGVARLNSRGGGWTGLKGPAWCYTGFEKFLYRLLVPVKQGSVSRSNGGGGGGGVVSSLMPSCCKDTRISSGVHLG